MFDTIFKAFGNDVDSLHELTGHLSSLEACFAEDYIKDQNFKEAAIDALIDYLQTLKNKK